MRQSLYTAQIVLNSLSGFLLLRAIGTKYGLSEAASAFDIAFSVPFYVMNISGFTFLHGILAAQLARLSLKGNRDESDLANSLINISLICSCAALVTAYFFLPLLVGWLAPGLTESGQSITRELLILTLPLTLTLGLGTLFGALFTAHMVPIVGEVPLCVSRLTTAAYLFVSWSVPQMTQVGLLLLITSGGGMIVQYWLARRYLNFRYQMHISFNSELREFLKVSIGLSIASVVAIANSIYMKRFATLGGVEVVASISFALALIGPLSLVIGRMLNFRNTLRDSRFVAAGNEAQRWHTLRTDIVLAVVFSGAASLVIMIWLPDLVSLLFGGGLFDAKASARVVEFGRPLVLSLIPAVLLWTVLAPALNSGGRYIIGWIYSVGWLLQMLVNGLCFEPLGPKVLVWTYTSAVFLQAALCIIISWKFRSSTP
jgi:peptidoglycan biosynthesis protein MviN/MurJ (putative lipid II flippase)